MRVQKPYKFLLIAGLLLALSALRTKAGMGIMAKTFILLSRYRALLPYMVAQAKHETANFTSAVYRTENNMFGMKNGSVISPGESVGRVSPEGNTYAHYETDFNSLEDLVRWFDLKGMPLNVDDAEGYAKAVTDRGYLGYNPSPLAVINYAKGIKRWL